MQDRHDPVSTLIDAGPVVALGLEWSGSEPVLRFGSRAKAGSRLFALDILRFAVADPARRYCCGWYDVSAVDRHVTCEAWRTATSGQCPACTRLEGFRPAHHAGAVPSRLPEHVRTYLDQPHLLYLAVFADGSAKVGTASLERSRSRLDEQGAVAAAYVARAPDGYSVRRAEEALARELALSRAVRTARKLSALQRRVDPAVSEQHLVTLLNYARPAVAEVAAATGATSLEPVQRWPLPAPARAALAATPSIIHPEPLSAGLCASSVCGVLGSIAVFTINTPFDQPYCADLTALRGLELRLDAVSQRPQPQVSTLF